MKQHPFQSPHSYGVAGWAYVATGLALMVAVSPALARDSTPMMGEHSQGMMDDHHGQAMMGDADSHDMTKDDDHRAGMMGAGGHMTGNGSHHMTNGNSGMRGRNGR